MGFVSGFGVKFFLPFEALVIMINAHCSVSFCCGNLGQRHLMGGATNQPKFSSFGAEPTCSVAEGFHFFLNLPNECSI